MKAALFLAGGLFCCGLAYLFFRYVPVVVAGLFGWTLPDGVPVSLGLAGVAAAWFSGYRLWKRQGGLYSYHESGFYHDLGDETAGALVVDHYAHRVTGPAYLLGQIFLAGPQGILRGVSLLHGRIPWSEELESRLEKALQRLRSANKWQGFSDHPDLRTEILYLAQMELIDFSGQKGVPRFKITNVSAQGENHR